MGARAFFGGFLDGFTMAGIWKPSLPVPGAGTRKRYSPRSEPDRDVTDVVGMVRNLTAAFLRAERKLQAIRRRNYDWIDEKAAAQARRMAPGEREIEHQLSVLKREIEQELSTLGLDEEQTKKLHAAILEGLRKEENPSQRRTRRA